MDLFPECRTETLHMSSQEPAWRRLWELAEVMLGSPEVLKTECAILSRLYRRFGAPDVERMLQGAMLMRWSSLTSLGSADGLGRRMALTRYWQEQQKHPAKLPERVRAILRTMGAP